MPILSELKTAVQAILTERPWVVPAKDETTLLKSHAKHILGRMASRWLCEASQQDTAAELHDFFQEMSTLALSRVPSPIIKLSESRSPKRKFSLASAAAEPSIVRSQSMPSLNISTYKAHVEQELTNCVFSQLENLSSSLEQPAAWISFLLEARPKDIAILICYVSEEAVRKSKLRNPGLSGSMIKKWMTDEAMIIQSISFSSDEIQKLFSLSEALIDPVKGSIPESPEFCLNSIGRWHLMESESLDGMQDVNDDYRDLIETIDDSGPTGIGYIVKNLPDDRSEIAKIRDEVLKKWQRTFPIDEYEYAEDEYAMQQELYFHERLLVNIDQFLDKCVRSILPANVLKMPDLEKQLQVKAEELENFPDDLENKMAEFELEKNQLSRRRSQLLLDRVNAQQDSEEGESQIAEIDYQLRVIQEEEDDLHGKKEVHAQILASISQINDEKLKILEELRLAKDILNEFKAQAFAHTATSFAIQRAKNRTKWSSLLVFDPSEPDTVINEEQFMLLVLQVVEALKARNFIALSAEEPGIFSQHLATLREMQNEKRSSAEGSLRTQSAATGEIHTLSESEVRDPLNRTVFIDLNTRTNGEAFCQIIIGACLYTVDQEAKKLNPPLVLPEIVQEWIVEKEEENSTVREKAKEKFIDYIRNHIKLPSEQVTALASFGLKPTLVPQARPIFSRPIARFGLLSKSRSVDVRLGAAAEHSENASSSAHASVSSTP